MQVHVDQEKCQGYLLCVNSLPEVFDEDEVGKGVEVGTGDVPAALEDGARNAIEECPMQAILARRRD